MGDNNAGSKVSYFLAGLGIGALVGILFAPKSGEETREYLTSKADEGRDYAQRKARELRERAEDLIRAQQRDHGSAEGRRCGGGGSGQRRLPARSESIASSCEEFHERLG